MAGNTIGPDGVLFLSAIKNGQSLGSTARAFGFSKEAGYTILRRRFLELRRDGFDVASTVAEMGFTSQRMAIWEEAVGRTERHHLCVPETTQALFWDAFDAGSSVTAAATVAGVARATGYRWQQKRFEDCRSSGSTLMRTTRSLRLTSEQARSFEEQRLSVLLERERLAARAHRRALFTVAEVERRGVALSPAKQRRAERVERYWQLMRDGVSNAQACRTLGVSRRYGVLLRREAGHQIPARMDAPIPPNRYLSLHERLQLADLRLLGLSIRGIATRLGRHPSTISRELRRHSGPDGSYQPYSAHERAIDQRRRPKLLRLQLNAKLRTLVQRKLNRRWSPQEICGWLRKVNPDEPSMHLCHETIYRALLLGSGALHKRYAAKLRTGRRLRKRRWTSRVGRGSRIIDMKPIHDRPIEATDKKVAGHWEGDLIVGVGSASAMVTLRERTTQYGIAVNLPIDHTAARVNEAIINAFKSVPPHLKRSLTWDQGVEMAAHAALTAATGIPIYFADRSSPWQRGANENYNGLLRQYFPKGSDLSHHSEEHVRHVVHEINSRPRRLLNYDTPAARFRAEYTAHTTAN